MPPNDGRAGYVRGNVKQVVIVAPAGSDQTPVRASAFNDKRCYFYVENTGTALGFFSWDEAFPGQTTRAIALLPGDFREWAYFIPMQSANYASVAGTTFAVIEGWPNG